MQDVFDRIKTYDAVISTHRGSVRKGPVNKIAVCEREIRRAVICDSVIDRSLVIINAYNSEIWMRPSN